MKFQACAYKCEKDSLWTAGIAVLKDFDIHTVHFILDENGDKVKHVWDFQLDGPADRVHRSINLSLVSLPNKLPIIETAGQTVPS